MSEEKDEIKEYADGWITERKGTDVPIFLKVAFIVIGSGAFIYFLIYMNGEVNHSDRGVLVRALNSVTKTADGLMYFIAALIAVYGIILAVFAFRKFHQD